MRALLGLVLVAGLAPSHLGSGDSVQPRDTEAVIESVVPALPDGVRVDIVGSDTFVRVRSAGHVVEVPGYEREPYMRIDADGRVEVNDGSVTSVLNGNRYGNVDLSQFTPTTKPLWREVADDGIAMWHDHRSHWMSPKPPAAIDESGAVQNFDIAIVVDGVPTSVKGTLYLRDRATTAWWLVGAVGLMTALAVAIARRRAMWLLLAVMSVAGLVVGVMEWSGLPRGARITPVMAVFSTAAALMAAGAASLRHRRREHLAPVINGGSAAALLTAVWLCSEQVTSAYVPGLGAEWAARAVIPMMLGVALVAVIDAVMAVVQPGSAN